MSSRQLMIAPVALAIFFGAVLIASLAFDAFPVGRDFKGGSLIRVRGENVPNARTAELAVEELLKGSADVETIENGLDIKTDNSLGEYEKGLVWGMFSDRFGVPKDAVLIETMGPTITGLYTDQAKKAIAVAFIAMGIIIFITFRRRVPVGATLLAVALDMLGVLGCMALFRVELSLASVAGMLMLLGYAVDTNILLTTCMLKRVGGEPWERMVSAMRTGLMMTGTTIIPILALNFFTTAPQIYELTASLIFGMVVDIFNTWLLNGAILLRFIEQLRRKEIHVSV